MTTIKLLQWNIFFKENIEHVVQFLKEVKADIMCLQELTTAYAGNNHIDRPKFIAENIGYNYYFAPAQHFSTGHSLGNAIFAKYQISNQASFYVKEQKEEDPEPWDEGRVVASCDVKIGKNPVTVATTHLSYTSKFIETDQKKEEAKKLLNYVKKKPRQFILAADLNIPPNSWTIKELEALLPHCGPNYDFPTFASKPFKYADFEEKELRWRLDYVFATPDIKVRSAKILKTKYSDHLPILVEFQI